MSARREFTTAIKRAAFERSNGACELCQMPFGVKTPEYDHRLPDALGGLPTLANCMAICSPCHKTKTATEDVPRIRKADRQKNGAIGARRPKQAIPSAPGGLRGPEKAHEGRGPVVGVPGIARRFR
jgi:5-methylcytosine-specific restriction endonuclease McrA